MSLIKKRECGVLAHITSLPSPYGIGSFGKNARDFVDWLKSCGQNYWQVLPLSPTGYGNSPYQSFSTFAGNPLLIDLEDLVKRGLLSADSCKESDYEDSGTVDFERVYKAKLPLLEEAFDNFEESEGDVQYLSFLMEEADWLDDYALFMAIKEDNGNRSWLEWSERELRLRAPRAVDTAREKYFRRIEFWKFTALIGFDVNTIGSENYTKTHVTLGKGAVLSTEKQEQEDKISDLEEQIVRLAQVANMLQETKKKMGSLTPDRENMLTTAIRSRFTLSREIKQRESRIAEINAELVAAADTRIMVRKDLWPGVKIRLGTQSMKIDNHWAKTMVLLDPKTGEIAFKPII